ncbi:uncharacterized protein LOC131434257 [Malaya genurostris]|uniref:uncharacterized protein LOC131434257 n=1 Tax=Malaya genurostris TaxID=325434 RepID=UPI0026F3D733|nr:uncharacterized protein LOC131434257 [Malaya genurostris]
MDFEEVVRHYSHLKGLYAAEQVGDEPRILIGLNNMHLLAPIESRIGNINEPVAVKSHLGWTIYGPSGSSPKKEFLGCHHGHTNQQLHNLMREYFMVEEAGITVNQLPESDDDRRANELLQRTTVRVGRHFETGLLWKQDDIQLPDSFQMALSRMIGLERRLQKNPALNVAVRQLIEDYLTKGYAHRATSEELSMANSNRVWYLPLSVVVHPKKPDKVRLVWDAAAKVKGTSLNSMLLVGPDLLTSLPAVIQQFRERSVAFSADIREMYHQIRITEVDKHAQRFLFRSHPSDPPEVYIMDVATFGAACSPASAQFIKNLNASQHADRFPSAAKAIIHRHYVDDYLDSTDTVTEAIERAKQVRYVHSQAGFTIRNWISNSAIFDQALDDVKKEEGIPLYDRKDKATERVLGIIWRPNEDAFTFSLSFHSDLQPYIAEGKRPTKRIALRCVMSLFDPLGLLAPFTVHGKMLLQKLWRTGCNWDQEMDDECFANWSRWMKVLPIVERLRIPRCYLRGASHEAYHTLQLHVFVDASEEAYGATAYFRIATSEGPRCSLVMAKTKVAPLKQLSIPRMELQGAVLGVRLLNIVEANHELKILKRVLWTDSMNVLSWIRSDQRKYKPFVAFRIGEILQETKIDEWRWLPSRANIADIITKWGKGISLDSDGTWFNGAQLLQTPEDRWPMQDLPLPNTREELRVCHMFHTEVVEEPLIDASRISRWLVLLRTVCCVYRFISNCRRKSRGLTIEVLPDISEIMLRLVLRPQLSVTVPLKQHEYHLAEIVLWKIAQLKGFACEVKTLSKNRQLP